MKRYLAPGLLFIAAAAWILIGTWALTSDYNPYLPAIRFAGIVLLVDSLILVVVAYTCDADVKERKWIIAEASASGLFCVLMLLDPVFTLFIFPFLVTPWIVAKGLLTIAAALSLKKTIHGWIGDLTGGLLLVCSGLLISHHAVENPYNVNLLIAGIGCTIGLLYLYDAFRFGKINPNFHKGPLGKTAA